MRESVTTDDGIVLHLRHWQPGGRARGTVLIVHGLGEHVGRYDPVARHLAGRGWQVAGYDLRGHGRSGGARGRIAGADDPLRDLAAVIDALGRPDAGPLVLLGHSMGGAIAARFVAEGASPASARWHRHVGALVLSSPALDPGLGAGERLLLAVLERLAPDFAVHNGVKPRHVSRDPAVVQAYRDDPLVHDRVAARLVRFLVGAGDLTRERAPAWSTPTLLMYAGQDKLVSPDGSRAFARLAPTAVVRTRAFDALYHEIFNEPEREQVFEMLTGWLDGLSASNPL